MPDHKIEGVLAGSVRGLRPEGVRPDEMDLLVPDGIEVDVEELEVDADQNHRPAGANPAQAVGDGVGAADAVVHDVEPAQQHAAVKRRTIMLDRKSGGAG